MKKLALVLGGGAAKGYAHLGVLKVLEKNEIIPDLIVGTSMGALVGGMYASGKPIAELEELASKFNSIGSFSLSSALFKGSLLNINKVQKIINSNFGNQTIEDLKIKFAAIGTNLTTGRQHVFASGSLADAVMASISIPGVFPKVKIGNSYYCDGGVTNNLAEDVAKELMPDAVIVSVDVLGDYEKQIEKLKFKTLENFINVTTIMLTNAIKNKPQYADLRISITQPQTSQFDFSGETALKTIKRGEMHARKHIEAIKELLKD